MDEKGRVLIDESLARWHETKGGRSDVEARHAEKRGSDIPGAIKTEKTAAGAPTFENSANNEGESGRTRYKTLTLHYENQQIMLEMALRRGIRYPEEAIKREANSLGNTLRAALERMIDQTAPRLAVMADPAERAALIMAEMRGIRRIIRAELPRALRRIRIHRGIS